MEKKYTTSLHIAESELEALAQFYTNQALLHLKNNDKMNELRCVTNASMLRSNMPEEMKVSFDRDVQEVKQFIKDNSHQVHDMKGPEMRKFIKNIFINQWVKQTGRRIAYCPHCRNQTDQQQISADPNNRDSTKLWQCTECNNFTQNYH